MWTAFARTRYVRLNGRYASDVTDEEYSLIEPLLPPANTAVVDERQICARC